MDVQSFTSLTEWVSHNGYFLIFLAMCLEGPIVTMAAAFAAALGFLNMEAVLLLAVLGDIVPDAVYYALGYLGRLKVIGPHGRHFGLSSERLERLDRLLRTHPGKALILVKFTPVLATPGLILAGASKLPLRKYAIWSLAITVPRVAVFAGLGYYSGRTLGLADRVAGGEYLALAAVLIAFGGYYGLRKLLGAISKNLGS